MYFELQMSGAVFTRVVRNRFRSIPLGVDLELPNPSGGILVVDQIIIGDATTLQREQIVDYSSGSPKVTNIATQYVSTLSPTGFLRTFVVPYAQVKQEVKVVLVSAADLEANGPMPTAPSLTLTIFPVYNISLKAANQTQGGGPLTLSYKLAYVDFGLAGEKLSDAQRAQITQVIGGVKIDPSIVDLSAMTKLLDRPVSAPVSAINAGIACDPTGTRVALRADFDVYGGQSPIAVEPAFFEAGPADLLAGKEWAMLMDANVLSQEAERRVKNALNAKANVRVLSDPAVSWDASETTLHIAADIRLINACPSFVDDIDLDVKLDIGVQYSVPKPDHLVIHYQLDSALTDYSQVFGCALTGVLLYPFAGAALFEKKKIGLLDYLGGIAFGPFLTFGQLVGVIQAQKLEDDISDSLDKTCHKLNDSEYECTSAVNLVIRLVPPLNSRFVLERAHGVPEGLVLSGPVANLGELFMGSIGDIGQRPFAWQVLGSCTGNGENNFRIGNQARIGVPYIPPAQVIKARLLPDSQNGYSLTVEDNEITVTPSNPPVSNPCKIRLITNRGVRTLMIPAAQPLNSAESEALQKALLGASLTCFYWEKHFTPIEKIGWLIDPAFHVIREGVRRWQILLKALDPSSTLTVRTPDGSTVATSRPSRNGNLRLSLLFAHQDGPSELSLELNRPPSTAATPVEVSVHQTLYSLRASLPVEGEVRRMEFTGALHQPHLEAITDRQSVRWDVQNSLAPHLLEAISYQAPSQEERREEWVLHNGREIGGTSTPNVTRAIANLVPRLGKPHAVGIRTVLGFANALYFRTAEGAAVYDIADPDQPEEIHSLSAAGWYEDTAASLKLMARYDRLRHVIDLYEVAVSSFAKVKVPTQPAPTMLAALGAAGIDFSVSEADLTDWLNNPEFTPYPALSEALLMLLDGKRLRRPVFLDVIVFNYEHSPGNPSPRKVEDVNFAVLEAAVLEGSNTRYGEAVSNFRDLLVNAV